MVLIELPISKSWQHSANSIFRKSLENSNRWMALSWAPKSGISIYFEWSLWKDGWCPSQISSWGLVTSTYPKRGQKWMSWTFTKRPFSGGHRPFALLPAAFSAAFGTGTLDVIGILTQKHLLDLVRFQNKYSKLKSWWQTVPTYWFIFRPFTNLPFGICAIYFDLKVMAIITKVTLATPNELTFLICWDLRQEPFHPSIMRRRLCGRESLPVDPPR